MKTSELLKKNQPVVYATLHNALKSSHLSHCYLFAGDKGTPKKETALLLAQSLICEQPQDGWGCEECIDCLRVFEDSYFDLICLDGSKQTIKIEEIEAMQQQFDKTALEAAGRKILIIDGAENMTGKAANSLLKLIEEPQGDLTVIFITERIERMLPTIVSRCQVVNFKPQGTDSIYRKAQELSLDPLNCHLLANLVQSEDQILSFEGDPAYRKAVSYFVEFANRLFNSYYDCVYYLQSTGFKVSDSAAEAKRSSRNCFSVFLSIAAVFAHDCLNGTKADDESWDSLLQKASGQKFNAPAFLKCVANSQDCLLYASNQALAVDQLLYNLKEVI